MLITLTLNASKVVQYNETIRQINKDCPDWNQPEVTTLDQKFVPYNKFSAYADWDTFIVLQQDYRKDFEGIYICPLNGNHSLELLTNYREAKNYKSPIYFRDYGVADNASQVMDYYDELLSKHFDYMSVKKFIILLNPIFRKSQPEYGGWRWHKWGPYIGVHDIKCEYLYDEKGIDYVYAFKILEVEEC